MEIDHFVDIHKEWRVPESTNCFDSLGDVSSILIDDYCIDMKYRLTDEDHTHWERMPLCEKHLKCVAKHDYAPYEIWRSPGRASPCKDAEVQEARQDIGTLRPAKMDMVSTMRRY
ncbi:hypothetical protein D1007_46253 [Hordeum vulgare]|nr:hypothetical protein D1007_46253 [Hordeum vulgare]